MDWSNELLATLVWLGKAFVCIVMGMAVAVVLLARFSVCGRQFRRITGSYFIPTLGNRRSVSALTGLAFIVLMTLFSVRMNVLFSFWYNGFYSAMQNLDGTAFWFMLLVFAILATVHVTRALINYYLRQAFVIHWRVWLTDA